MTHQVAPFCKRRLAERPKELPLTQGRLSMDLNYLYFRQQVSQFGADNAACVNARRAHQDMADAYSALIKSSRSSLTLMAA